MIQDTEVLYAAAGVSGAQVRSSIYRFRPQHERTHEAVQVSITVGTGTISLEGRVSANDPWVVLSTLTSSDIVLVPAGLELSVNVTAATGLTARVAGVRPLAFVA